MENDTARLDGLRAVVGGVPVILSATDRAGLILLSEGGGLADVGRTPGASVGQSVFDLYRDHPTVLDATRRACAGESTTTTVTLGGAVYQAHYTPLRAADGAVFGSIGLGVDITPRLRAEEALAASEAQYRALVGALHDGVVMHDAAGQIIACNASAERILGLTADQLAGRSSFDPRWRAIRDDGTPFPGEVHPAMVALGTGLPQLGVSMGIRQPDGTLTWITINAQPLFAPQETRPYAVVASFADVTAQRAATEQIARSEARFRALTEQSSDLIVVADAAGAVQYRSGSTTRLLGYPTDMPPTSTLFGMSHPDDHERVADYLAACLRSAHPLTPMEVRLRHRDGSWPCFEAVAQNRLDDPAIGGIVITLRDITARKVTELALRESEARLQDFLDNASDLIQSVDTQGRIVYANRAWRETLGYDGDALDQVTLLDIIAPEERAHCRALLDTLRDDGATLVIETIFLTRDGRRIPVEGGVNCRMAPDGARLTRGIFRDVTARRLLEAELARRATHDTLTGLPNRALFAERLAEALSRAARAGSAVAVLFIDLDGFKAINDRLGHAAGDLLLATVAGRLRECIRGGDTAARLGGDEFALLLEPLENTAEALDVARRAIAALAAPIFIGDITARVAASIGIARSTPGDTAAELLAAADAAMYAAKRAGKGRYALAPEDQRGDRQAVGRQPAVTG